MRAIGIDAAATVRPSASFIVSLAAAALLFTPPYYVYILHGVSVFGSQSEFVSYRVSDALSIHFGETAHVHPVQGLPTALISKYVTLVLFRLHDGALLSRPVLQTYGIAVIATLAALAAGAVVAAHRFLRAPDCLALMVFAVFPWVITGPSVGLLIAPEYWMGEYAFLFSMLAYLAWLRHGAANTMIHGWLIGALTAVAAALKVSLAPLGLLLLAIVLTERREASAPALGLRAAAAFAVVYFIILFLYMGLDIAATVSLLKFQLAFYRQPNSSHMYDGLAALIARHPSLVTLSLAALALSFLAWRRPLVAAASVLWVLVLWYLVAGRRHDTSATSAFLSLLFLNLVLLLLSARRLAAGILVALALAIAAWMAPLWNYHGWISKAVWEKLANPDEEFARGFERLLASRRPLLLYLPGNDWNAALIQQAFAYNGGLAHRMSRHGYTGAVLERFFPGLHYLGQRPAELDRLPTVTAPGATVFWTRNVAKPEPYDIEPDLVALGCSVTHRTATLHSDIWDVALATCPERP